MSLRCTLAIGAFVFLAAAGRARAADPPRANPFACLGEGESLVRGLRTDEVTAEVAKRVAHPPEGGTEAARHHCVTAELMRRVGDGRASAYYQQAIAADPDEPGFELWYGHYLRNVRGPRQPLHDAAEAHYQRGLAKLRALEARGALQDFDAITRAWLQRGLIDLHQADGLPLLASKAYPYRSDGAGRLGAALTVIGRVSRDTNEPLVVDDARRFAAEAAFAASVQRLARPLDADELRGLARTPLRHGLLARLRLRLPALGALDLHYERLRAPASQISAFTWPNRFTDVAVDQYGVGWRRAFDLAPLLDLALDLAYRRVLRTGVVEWFPALRESLDLFEARPALARFFGPDKATLGLDYVYMRIPVIPGGVIQDRMRGRVIAAGYLDYAIYRPLLLPDPDDGWQLRRTPTRGLHLYGGYALDDEVYGVRVVHRRDTYGGVSLRGVGGFDVTLQATLFTSDTREDERARDNTIVRRLDAAQSIRQWRPTLVLLYRLVDEEAIPDLPRSALAGLNLVLPVRADFASAGPDAFDNLRGGVELWSKVISTDLRGTNFLVTAGYEAQWFHRLKEVLHMGKLEARMGWGQL